MQIKWLKVARADLDAEISYIAKEDKKLAQKIYASIREQVENLANFPNRGRPGRVFGTRELVLTLYSYIVPYRAKDEIIEVLSVFHTKRQLPDVW